VFGTSAAFFHEPAGSAPLNASYLQGRDLTVPPGLLGRSLSNPIQTQDADHYTLRVLGGDPHYNGVILGHAFFLAIEGGRNRVSGRTVTGVGAANREQIEKAFFRALTVLLPASSTFGLTRTATIQAARDLYGAGSAPERAITEAWDAVGVQERTAPTAAVLPSPAAPANVLCGGQTPSWVLGLTVSAGASNLRITQWQIELFDGGGRSVDRDTLTATQFAQFFNQCGPGNSQILAQTDACTAICIPVDSTLTNGAAQTTFTALDEANRTVTFSSSRTTLQAPR